MSSQINHHSPTVQKVLNTAAQEDRRTKETRHLQAWLSDPDRRAMLNIRGIERTCELPASTLKNWLSGSQGLAPHHLDNIVRMLTLIGYKPATSDYRFICE